MHALFSAGQPKTTLIFSTLSSLSTQPIKHCLHWKTNGRWERGRWGEREDVVWLGQLGSLEGHSCALFFVGLYLAQPIWSGVMEETETERERKTGREKNSRCTTAVEVVQKSARGQRWQVRPVTFIVTVNNSGRQCRNCPSLQSRAVTCGPVLFMTMTNIFPSNYGGAQ